jgi:hypothetical protein
VGDWLRGLTRATPEPTAVVAEAAAEPEASDLPDARMEQEAPDATAVREQSAESEVTPEAEAPSVVLEQYEEPVVVAAETPMESMILVREFEESGPMPAADVAATPDDLEMDTEPATEPEPAAEPEAAAEPEPTVEREAVAEAEPLLEAEPIAEPEPVVEPEAVAEAAEAAGPATLGPQPTAEEDPFGWGEVASSEPVPGPMTTFEAGTLEVVGADDRSGMEPVEQPEAGTAATAPSLDELFARPVAPAAEAAAGTLVAATLSLQDDRDIDAQLSQAASDDPASLEHVLRETAPAVPGRPTPTFSFEQFFTPALGTAPAPEQPTAQAPAETEAAGDDDLDEFHAWLAGLSDS